jgi:hypothetical protein
MVEITPEYAKLRMRELFAIIFCSIAIAIVAGINGMNPEWARSIATSLLTVAGLVFGFVILGVTNLTDKDLVKALHEYQLRKNFDKLFNKLHVKPATKAEEKSLMQKELSEAIGNTYKAQGYVVGSFLTPIIWLLISIGFSFSIYGMNTTANFLNIEWLIFDFLLYFSLVLLFAAVYSLFKIFIYIIGASTLSYCRLDKKMIEQIINERTKDRKEETLKINTSSQSAAQ